MLRKKQQAYLIWSTKCNLQCPGCPLGNPQGVWPKGPSLDSQSRVLKPELVRKLIEYYDPGIIVHYGGEPLLEHPKIREIISEFPGREHLLYTNGILLTPELIKQFSCFDKLLVTVSLDGNYNISKINRPMRAKDYRAIANNLPVLVEVMGDRAGLCIMVGSHNIDIIDEVISGFHSKYGIRRFQFSFNLDQIGLNMLRVGKDSFVRAYKYIRENNLIIQWDKYATHQMDCVANGACVALLPNGEIYACDGAALSQVREMRINHISVCHEIADRELKFESKCDRREEGKCKVAHCTQCYVDNIIDRGNPYKSSEGCQATAELMSFYMDLTETKGIIEADTLDEYQDKREQMKKKPFLEEVFARRVLPNDLSLVFQVLNRFHSATRDHRPPSAEEIVKGHQAGAFNLSRMICWLDGKDERPIGFFNLTEHDNRHGWAEGGIYYFGNSWKDRIAFGAGLAQGMMNLHLEDKIFTCLSEIVLPNDSSVKYTHGAMNFKQLGVIPGFYTKEGIPHDAMFNYGNLVTTYEGMLKMKDKGVSNPRFDELMEKGKKIVDQIGDKFLTPELRYKILDPELVTKESQPTNGVKRIGLDSDIHAKITKWHEDNPFDTPNGVPPVELLQSVNPEYFRSLTGGALVLTSVDHNHGYAEFSFCFWDDVPKYVKAMEILNALMDISLDKNIKTFLHHFPDESVASSSIIWDGLKMNYLGFIPGMFIIRGRRRGSHFNWLNREGMVESFRRLVKFAEPTHDTEKLACELESCKGTINGF